MRSKFGVKFSLLAGMMVLATAAQAGLLDATVFIDRAANSRVLTVRYTGAAAALVELRIKGQSVATRSVNDEKTTGETTFSVDTAALEDGDNDIEIRLYDADGKVLSTQKSIISVERRGNGPVFLEKPRAGATVQGPVEIKLGLRATLSDVYVSFFINDVQKMVRNVPPYTYLWDTERYPNGWHEVQAIVIDGANNTFRTEKMRLFVNNPGGRTNRAGGTSPVSSNTGPIVTSAKTDLKGIPGAGIAQSAANATVTAPQIRHIPVLTAPVVALSGNQPMAAAGATAATKPANLPSGQANGHQTLRPSLPNSAPIAIAGQESVQARHALSGASLAPIAVTYGRRINATGSFGIVLDGKPLNFDVEPRFQQGVPITPFRHLFQEAGGTVYFRHASKEVQANGMGREVLFKVGNDIAKVNGSQIKFELAPFIDRSRVLVPMSFLVDSLKIRVDFDPATGHVLVSTQDKK